MNSSHSPLILHFVTWYPSATNHAEGVFIQRQIELLAANDQFRHIVVRKNKTVIHVWEHLKALLGFFKTERIGTATVISLPNESRLYRFFFWRFRQQIEQRMLHRLYKKFQPSIAHLHVVYGFAEEAIYLKKKKNLPFLVSEHMGPFPFDWITAKKELIIEPMKQSSKVVAVSRAQAKQIELFTGVVPVIIPNVIHEKDFFYTSTPKQPEKQQQFNIVFTGVYTKAKGGDYLVSVFPDFLKTYPGTVLHMVGYATEERMKELQTLLQQTGIQQHVRFHGNLSATQLNALYQQCDFYVCSSEWESFGLSVLEGLFTGLPALCTNCGGVSDFINDENGILIPNDQQHATLLNGMLKMAAAVHQYNRQQIAEQVRSQFSSARIQHQYFDIYKEILNNSSAA